MRKIIKKIKVSHLVFIFILGLSFSFRFYKIYDWLFFSMDQEYEALLVKNIISGTHFPLIGVNASDTGLYLGPAFIYFASLPYAIFHGNPLGGAVFASLIGVLTTFMVFKLGKEWFSDKVGLVASFLWATSFLTFLYDRQFWNPTPIPLLSIIILYSLTKIAKGYENYLIILAISLGFALQSHLQAIILIPVIILYLLLNNKKYPKNYLFAFLLILFLFQLPLILFDLRHNFTNTKALFSLIGNFFNPQNIASISSLNERLYLFFSMLGRAFYVKSPADLYVENGQCKALLPYVGKASIVVVILILICFVFYFYKKIKNNEIQDYNLIGIVSIFTAIFLLFYNRLIYEYYFLYFMPILFLVTAWVLISLYKKRWQFITISAIILLFIFNVRTATTAYMSFNFRDKISAISFAKQYVDDNNFSHEALGECSRFGGYRYLFEYFGKKPGSSYMDPYFAWIYGEPQKKEYPRKVIFSVVDEREREKNDKWRKEEEKENQRMIARGDFGKIRVLVVENEQNKSIIPNR